MKKTAVVLFNLGGPDSRETIKPFLFNFFMDKNIIRAPALIRYVIASYISSTRSKNEARWSYDQIGGKSPLLENTQAQADALQKMLGENYKVFVCMRYWNPMAYEVAPQVKEYDPDLIVCLPLYPQYSTTTTWSAFQAWSQAAAAAKLDVKTVPICCYPRNQGFVKASAMLIRKAYLELREKATKNDLPAPRLLFSAHGLPEAIIKDGDPYEWQCEMCAEAIFKEVAIPGLDARICYQSRVGRMKWIGPSAEEALEAAAEDGVPVLMYPHSFTQEHVETLVEIEIEFREFAEEVGVPLFARVETVGTEPVFIEGLANLVRDAASKGKAARRKECPPHFGHCYCECV